MHQFLWFEGCQHFVNYFRYLLTLRLEGNLIYFLFILNFNLSHNGNGHWLWLFTTYSHNIIHRCHTIMWYNFVTRENIRLYNSNNLRLIFEDFFDFVWVDSSEISTELWTNRFNWNPKKSVNRKFKTVQLVHSCQTLR